jgi:hypothetical protein
MLIVAIVVVVVVVVVVGAVGVVVVADLDVVVIVVLLLWLLLLMLILSFCCVLVLTLYENHGFDNFLGRSVFPHVPSRVFPPPTLHRQLLPSMLQSTPARLRLSVRLHRYIIKHDSEASLHVCLNSTTHVLFCCDFNLLATSTNFIARFVAISAATFLKFYFAFAALPQSPSACVLNVAHRGVGVQMDQRTALVNKSFGRRMGVLAISS